MHRKRRQSDGGWRVSGRKPDGTRVKWQKFATEAEADTYIAMNFAQAVLDEWGLPANPAGMKIDEATATKLNAGIGIQPSTPTTAKPDDEEIKRKRKMAMGLADFAGTAWATGTVYASRRICDNADKKPLNPDPKQVQNLAESVKDTIQGWFGDKEIKPWQMALMLTFGIPIVMLIQSPPKEKGAQAETRPLKSVP